MKKLIMAVSIALCGSIAVGCTQGMVNSQAPAQTQHWQHKAHEANYRYQYDHNRIGNSELQNATVEDLADLMYQDEAWVRHELSLRGFHETDSGYFVNAAGNVFFVVFDSGKCVDIKGV